MHTEPRSHYRQEVTGGSFLSGHSLHECPHRLVERRRQRQQGNDSCQTADGDGESEDVPGDARGKRQGDKTGAAVMRPTQLIQCPRKSERPEFQQRKRLIDKDSKST